jgi:transposase-like protein
MTPETTVNPMTTLSEVLQNGHKDTLLALLAHALRDFMEAEASQLCGAPLGARSAERQNQRNGYRDRPFETRLGSLELAVPKLRQGSYFPSFLTPRRRWEQAFVNVVATAYVEGVSTRKMEELVEAMGAKGMSKSEVSRMAASLDEQVKAFRERRLDDKEFPYVWLDAMYVKVRQQGGGSIVSKAVLVAFGVNQEGEREVLGVDIANSEMTRCWQAFLQHLVGRGLHGVRLVVSDAHSGLRAAIQAVLNGTTWQRCYVHFIRDVLSHLPKSQQGFVAAALRNVFQQTSLVHAREAMAKVITLLEAKYPSVAELLVEAEDDVLAYFAFPDAHWRQIRSTNPLERINKELRRRVRVIGVFPNDAAVLRLLAMILVEQHDEWAAGDRRYFAVSSMRLLYGALPVEPGALEERLAAK